MKPFKEGADLENILSQLMTDILFLTAQFDISKMFYQRVVLNLDPDVDKEKINAGYDKAVRMAYEDYLVTHPYFSDYWKNKLKLELDDIPGLRLI